MLVNVGSFVGLKPYHQNPINALVSSLTQHVLLYFYGSIYVKEENVSFSLTPERDHNLVLTHTDHKRPVICPRFSCAAKILLLCITSAAALCSKGHLEQADCLLLLAVEARISVSPAFKHRPWGKSSQQELWKSDT